MSILLTLPVAFRQEVVLLSFQLSGLPWHHSLLHYRSFSMKLFAFLPSLATRSWIVYQRPLRLLLANLSNLQSKVGQSEPNWNDLLGRCWFSQVYSLPTVNASKKDICNGVKHFHKGVASCTQEYIPSQNGNFWEKKKRASRSAMHPPMLVHFPTHIRCAS